MRNSVSSWDLRLILRICLACDVPITTNETPYFEEDLPTPDGRHSLGPVWICRSCCNEYSSKVKAAHGKPVQVPSFWTWCYGRFVRRMKA